ncbi:MAG: GAF domain-containing protein [Proteobacteria bacterium]|nr:GAF domain-containing protein [Pseudomonadota bacterium]
MPCSYICHELHNLQFFSELTDEECGLLLPFLQQEMFQQGELVVQEGAFPDRLFVVVKGKVRKEKVLGITVGASGLEAWQEKELFEVKGAGQHFCEDALIAEEPANVDWVAMEKSELFSLSAGNFRQIQQESEQTGRKLLQALSWSLYRSFRKHEGQFAAEVENKKLLSQMRVERKKIKAMHRIARSTSVSSVNQTLDTILEACMDCLDVQKGSIMIFNRGVLRVEAAFGRNKDKILGQMQVINETSVSGRCFMSKKPIFIQNIEQEKGIQRSPDPSQYSNNSLISMPLISPAGESIGVLNVSKTSQAIFTENDMKILEDLTLEASAALAHEICLARLYRNFQETLLEVKQAQRQLVQAEEKILRIIQTSWPSMEAQGAAGND